MESLPGTGSIPRFGPKRQGKHAKNNKVPYRLMDERMRVFVVPEGLEETEVCLGLQGSLDVFHPDFFIAA
jgi:hypothetical protein